MESDRKSVNPIAGFVVLQLIEQETKRKDAF
jgi:hypothetical protein